MKGPVIAGLAAMIATFVIAAPASLASLFIDFSGSRIAVSSIDGTIWNGVARGLSVNAAPLGDVSYRLSPLSLLTLSPKVSFDARGGAVIGQGVASVRPGGGFTLSRVKADIALDAVAPKGLFGEPARGVARIDIARLDFSPARGCKSAEGTLWTNVLDAPSLRFGMPALPLSGTLACDGDDLRVALSGENPSAGADISLRIDRTFAYELAATVKLSKDDMASAFRMFGFEDANGALTYGSTGVLRSAGS
ncbi:MAG: type II secretion system protein N [Parvularculaceae bacterium]